MFSRWLQVVVALVCAASAAAAFALWRRHEPNWLVERQAMAASLGRSDVQNAALNRLADLGSRSIDPILTRIEVSGPWFEETRRLPEALRRIGSPAHGRLMHRLDRAQQARSRVFLIYTLQEAFGDFSRLPEWLSGMERGPKWGMAAAHRLRPQLMAATGTAPPRMFIGVGARTGFTAEFVRWYGRHAQPGGPLPGYRFSRTGAAGPARSPIRRRPLEAH